VALFLSSLVDGCFVLKRFVFNTIARLFNDTRILAFDRYFQGVDRMILNELLMFFVSCEGALIAFLSVSASSSLPEDSISGFRLVATQPCQMYLAQ